MSTSYTLECLAKLFVNVPYMCMLSPYVLHVHVHVYLPQDVDRLHREMNGLNSTVAAQGKEVERLQRENQALKGDIETHKITVSSVCINIIIAVHVLQPICWKLLLNK